MHVIILCDFAVPSGGSQRVAIESARALAEAGVAVTYLHGVSGHDPRLDHARIKIVDLGLTDVWNRPALEAAASGIWSRHIRRRVAGELARLATPDTILHLHQWTRAFSPSVFAASLETGLPFAVTAHDYFLSCPNGVYFLFNRQQPCSVTPLSWRCLSTPCDPKSSALKAIRVLRSFATARAINGHRFDVVHVSDRGQASLAPLLPAGLIHHRIDNPIAVPREPPAEIAADAPFAYIGRLTREKGAVLAAAAAHAASVPIAFIGEGPAEGEIRAANPNAHIFGWCAPAQLAELLQTSVRAVVAPSLWLETGPLTVAEAAARGVSAIASSRCGGAERIKHGTTGLVVEPEVTALASAMQALSAPATARAFGQAAYDAFWASPQAPDVHGAMLISLYETMLARTDQNDANRLPPAN